MISHDSEQILAFFKNNMDAMKRQGYFTVVIENDISKQEVKLIQESEPLSKVLKLNIILPIKSMDEEVLDPLNVHCK